MNAVIRFLETHRILSYGLALFYFLAVVLPHEWVGKQIEKYLDKPLGRDNYNLLILSLALILGLSLGFVVIRSVLKQLPQVRNWLLGLFILNLAFLTLAFNTIVVINIELIHVVQYALMAILIFPLVGNYRDALFWTSFLGALDELYQYLVIAAGKSFYYDFNDVVINMLGASLGLILVRAYGVEVRKSYANWIDSPSSKAMLAMIFILLISVSLGWVGYKPLNDPSESKAIFEFMKENKPGFWRTVPPNVRFHVMKPLEGFIFICLIFNIFKNIGYKFDVD